ncbi:asparagine synthase (glutamine-hydrolyzing) [Patescibacteria group bacterium]|nr:asparagine synthase (glutamine-hydrolyzing) [Patescibacteria group bacterium]
MCGINGFNFKSEAAIRAMNAANAHRGPDRTAAWCEDGVSLGHNRLSIIDLSHSADQPMTDISGRYMIVFNGEIYNFRELREELAKTYAFSSKSDTEVILAAYRKYGADCVNRLNGIFAFAIWDKEEQELFLARDHAGVKPLYYYFDGKRFIFSSEIKSILVHQDVRRAVDPTAFNLYFRMLYVPEPYTMFAGIKKLPPAHHLTLKGTKLTIEKYWEVSDFTDVRSHADAVKHVKELFDASVRRQLISDRPVGVFLSGGMDSTAVLGSALKTAPGKMKTYAVGFEDSLEPEKFNADVELARRTAQFYGTDHHELMISGDHVKTYLESIAWHMDEPNANPTAAAIYLLAYQAKKDVAVVLGGDGADELFGGYPRYNAAQLVRLAQRLLGPSWARRGAALAARAVGKHAVARKITATDPTEIFLSYLAQPEELLKEALAAKHIDPQAARHHFSRYFSAPYAEGEDPLKRFMNVDRQSWLVDDSLLRTDKMTMAFGLEERVPILDRQLIEYANRIPVRWKFAPQTGQASFAGKEIWKQAVEEYLPEHIVNQKKRGWFTPMAKWMRGPLKPFVEGTIARLEPEFFDRQGMERMFADHLSGKRYNLNMIWAVVMWQLWYDRFIKG